MQRAVLVLCLLYFAQLGIAQLSGFQVPEGKKTVEIPFRFENNFILLDVVFNKIFPLTFIFDTGSENTILTHKTFADMMDVNYDRKYTVYGSDMQQELLVHLARGVQLDLHPIPSRKVPILVLEENYFQFEKYTGIKIHGILGMDLFKLVIIQIDYKKKKLILHHPESFKEPSDKFQKFQVEIQRGKFYLDLVGEINQTDKTPLKLLVDSGANIALLLQKDSTNTALSLPEKLIPGKLGDGLGGYLEGFMGRTKLLSIGPFSFTSVITHFQVVPEYPDSIRRNDRNGILGNEILSRFNVIMVGFKNTLYLKPNKKYNRGFNYDRSGLTLVASGLFLDKYTILDVIDNSPAGEAGLQKGDVILSINRRFSRGMSLNEINYKFQKRIGKRFRLKILRNGKKQVIYFRLRDLI